MPTTIHDAGKTTQISPNEVKFAEVVRALLAESHTHHELKQRLHQLVMEAPVEVLYCTPYGGFGFSEAFTTFVHCRTKITDIGRDCLRWDPTLIQAINDYGRSICDKYPFILNDMRSVYGWKLDQLFAHLEQLPMKERELEFNSDLVAEAIAFAKQMSDSKGRWREDCLGSFPEDNLGLDSFVEKHPDFWMSQRSMYNGLGTLLSQHAHMSCYRGMTPLDIMLNQTRYKIQPFKYERIGLYGAGTSLARLAICEIPALDITVYDGLESVEYGCGGGKGIFEDIE